MHIDTHDFEGNFTFMYQNLDPLAGQTAYTECLLVLRMNLIPDSQSRVCFFCLLANTFLDVDKSQTLLQKLTLEI